MRRDILTTLQREHETLRGLFAEIDDTTDRARKGREQLLDTIEDHLLPHASWEESVFYPAFAERADREGLKIHAIALLEHHAVEQVVLPEVHAADFDTPEFAGRVKVFGEMIDHHAQEEEATLFKLAKKLFSAEERAALDEEYETWKRSNQAALSIAAMKGRTGLKAVAKSLTD